MEKQNFSFEVDWHHQEVCIMLWVKSVVLSCFLSSLAFGAGYTMQVDQESGFKVYEATRGQTSIKLVPEAGNNVYSIKHGGVELLRGPEKLKDLPGFHYGNPILYPSPNRVKGSEFTFGKRTYKFTPNDGKNFLHGIVHSSKWEMEKVTESPEAMTFHTKLEFKAGTKEFELFPHTHVLRMNIQVTDGMVKFEYTVDNSNGEGPLPFGVAFHPWFLYQGTRANTFLTVPADGVMQVDNGNPPELLPTGKVLDVAGTKFDCRAGRSLENWVVDDVFIGMKPEQPAVIDYRDKGLKVTLKASDAFTHLVVYTPDKQPWFCVENQTCSTDAHNLYAKGLKDESHLQIAETGKYRSGTVEFIISR